MSKKSTKPTSRSFERLLKAEDAQQIVDAVIACCWEAQGNEGEPPILPFVDLQTFTDTDLSAQYVDSHALVSEKSDWVDVTLKSDIERAVGMDYDDWIKHELKRMLEAAVALDKMAKEQGISIEQLRAESEQRLQQQRQEIERRDPTEGSFATVEAFRRCHEKRLATTVFDTEQFHAVGLFLASSQSAPTKVPLEWLHQVWLRSRKLDPTIPHFLVPLAKAWLTEQTAKHITAEYDRLHPVAVIKHQMGSIRDINFVDLGDATLRKFASPERGEQIQTPQLLFDFAEDAPSILPAVMPLHVAHPMGVKATTKKGAVSHVVRIFFEALMALKPSQHQADIMFRVGDLIDYLYPDGLFNRTNQLPHIIKALDILHFYATVPFRDDQGALRAWRPVTVKSLIDINAKNDTPVFMRVDLPPDAQQGYIILKKIHRHLGKVSGPQFNAYHAAAWLWDRHGTVKGKLIDPTRPIEKRNDTGLVDSTGKPIVDEKGKPITNIYHPRAVAQLDRERNPAADRYPMLSDKDLILACNPNGYNPKTRKRDLKRAKEHWTEMEKSGIICIERLPQGWRIMPGTAHMKGYRGAKDAQKKKR